MRRTDIRLALDELQLRPTKSLGQNFLHDQNLARAIAAAALPVHVPFAVELGPGLGSLTGTLTIANWAGSLTGSGSEQLVVYSTSGAPTVTGITFAGWGAATAATHASCGPSPGSSC